MRQNKVPETPQAAANSVKTEVEQSGMPGEKKQVVPELAEGYLKADRSEQENLESQLPAGTKMTVEFESDGHKRPVIQSTDREQDTTDPSTKPRMSQERSSDAAKEPSDRAQALWEPRSNYQNLN